MPELPEVETILRNLKPYLKDCLIKEVFVNLSGVNLSRIMGDLLLPDSSFTSEKNIKLVQKIKGRIIKDLFRRGKYIFLLLSSNNTKLSEETSYESVLLFHLGMTGQLILCENLPICKESSASGGISHLHLALQLQKNNHLREKRKKRSFLLYRDVRRFGKIKVLSLEEYVDLSKSLGPEPLSISWQEFKKLTQNCSRLAKAALLDQHFLAGLGNIYTDEVLYRAKIHPQQKLSSLSCQKLKNLYEAIQSILKAAIAKGGSSISDYRLPDGSEGHFQFEHAVYGREGSECLRCGKKIIRKKIAGRSTFFCPNCQRIKKA